MITDEAQGLDGGLNSGMQHVRPGFAPAKHGATLLTCTITSVRCDDTQSLGVCSVAGYDWVRRIHLLHIACLLCAHRALCCGRSPCCSCSWGAWHTCS